jgi:hypothetical protein
VATLTRIDKAGAAELDVWAGLVVTASSVDEVLGAKVPPNKAMQPTRAQPRSARRRTRGLIARAFGE